MNLHRTTGKPDWDSISPSNRTFFQKVAVASDGILTPANVITIIGLGLVIYGLIAIIDQQFWLGLISLAVGRLLDIVDGFVAEVTRTKSPLGELLDASVDKIGTILTIVVFFVADITYWWVMVLLLIPQVITSLLIFYKRSHNIKTHPTRTGKLSMASAWLGLIGLLALKAVDIPWPSAIAIVVYGLVISSFALGLYAFWQYLTERD